MISYDGSPNTYDNGDEAELAMGVAGSRNVESAEAYKVFSEKERQHLSALFEQLSSGDSSVFEYDAFQGHMVWLFPEDIVSRLFKEMCRFEQAQKVLKQPVDPTKVGKHAFFTAVSHCVKQDSDQNGSVFYILSADSDQIVTSVEMEDLCACLLNSYAVALNNTVAGSQWKLKTDRTNNQRFAKMAVKELLGDKENPSCVYPGDIPNWFTRFPLIQHLFVAMMRAWFFGVEGLVEEAHHGLSEGCQETVEHIQYDTRSHILLPCKLDIDFSKCSTLLNIPSVITINHHLPATLRHRWRLLFSTQIHGESFQAFVHQIVNQGPTVLVIRDCDGHVFGGFASKSWAIKSHFDGDSDCFLFSLSPTMAVYHPTGYNNNFMYLNMSTQTMPNGLGMGGQLEYFGLWLDHSFGPGHSCARPTCTTYGSAQLSAQQKFKLNSLEVWGVGVPPEVQLEKRSILDTEVEAKAFLEIAGKEIHSEGLREPEDY